MPRLLILVVLAGVAHAAPTLVLSRSDGETNLALEGGPIFHATVQRVLGAEALTVEPTGAVLCLWEEQDDHGTITPWYAVSLDGRWMDRVCATSYLVHMRRVVFDPALHPPDFTGSPLGDGGNLYLVQFRTQPLECFREVIRELGGRVYGFVPNHTHIVHLPPEAREAVSRLPWVRWIGPYHPEYRLEPVLLQGLRSGELTAEARYHIQVLERGIEQKQVVADRVQGLGGVVDPLIPDGFRLQARLTPALLGLVATWDEVLYVDRWSPPEDDMNLVRQNGGADYLETTVGYTGQGVRAEVMDGNVLASHVDFATDPIIFHGPHGGTSSHGTSTTGIVFGDGTANPQGRGMLPDGQPIFADYDNISNRYTHTAELLTPTYEAVFQSNSWGGTRNYTYSSTSMEMDDIIFNLDFLICQSQSNAGTQASRPQAWAKNIVSVGATYHYDTLTLADDQWDYGASIGPAEDGRVKPDLCYWYDSIRAPTSSSTTAYTQFGGTSAATPMTAGHFGLFYQMWSQGLFGNPTPGSTVFSNRPHCATARAMLINTAIPYGFSGVAHDLTRMHQGWGIVNVQRLYDLRDRFFIVDETTVLPNMGSATFPVYVAAGEPELRVTLVYKDPPGTTSALQHRINDLSLRVMSPSATVYEGNMGLDVGNWSVPGGSPDTLNVVENVFLQSPAQGQWIVEVRADEVNQDSHLGTPALDADFALVVSGVTTAPLACGIIPPPWPPWGDLALDFDVFSQGAAAADGYFEFSTDAGLTFLPCTTAPASAVPSPFTGRPIGPGSYTWDSLADGLAVAGVTPGVLVRLTVDDGVAPAPAECTTMPFDVIPEPPSCTLTGPAGIGTRDIVLQLDGSSPSAAQLDVTFEYTLDGGATYLPCTAGRTSPLANPASGVPTGVASFRWDSIADQLGLLAPVSGVQVRARVDDLFSPAEGECLTLPFQVDNVPPPPGCTIAAPVPAGWGDTTLAYTLASRSSPTVDLQLDYSLDGGVTFNPCSSAFSSPLTNPALGVSLGAGSFVWSTLLDHVGEVMPETSVQVRITITDLVVPQSGSCVTPIFTVDNRPSSCSVTPPASPARGPVPVQVDTVTVRTLTVGLTFEYSTDGGSTFDLCTAAATSPVSNPGAGVPAGAATFIWESRLDGVGHPSQATGVLVRCLADEGVGVAPLECVTPPFDVDNTQLCGGVCGDCDLNATGPDVLDALVAAQLAASILTPSLEQEYCCDVDGSSTITVLDALALARQALSLPVTLSCP